jgi:TonB family protein
MRQRWLVSLIGMPWLALFCVAGQTRSTEQVGFVNCAAKSGSVPLWQDSCTGNRAGEVACGERVDILAREASFFKIRTSNGERYIGAASVSRSPDRFVAIDFKGPSSQPDCASRVAELRVKAPGKQAPRPLYTPNPEYTDQARKAKLQGIVVLSCTIGIDGRAHDIKVEKGLGMGLDEQAVAALEKWRFDPAREGGKPFPAKTHVEVSFRKY